MKHIKKVFLELKNSDFPIDNESKPQHLQNLKKPADYLVVRADEDGHNHLGFIHKNKGEKNNFIINIPSMPMVFFDSAYTSNLHLKVAKKKLFEGLNNENNDGKYHPQNDHNIYRFIGYSTSVIILLCNSLECFANEMIAQNKFIYINKLGTKTESFDHIQIQNYVDFKTKLFKILPNIFKKDLNPNSLFLQPIHNLISFRNDITHLKLEEDLIKERSAIVRKLLNFDYDKSIVDVRKFINYFNPNFLQDCDCEGEF